MSAKVSCPNCGGNDVEFVGNDDNREHRCSECTVIWRMEQAETPADSPPRPKKKVQGATSRKG